MLVVMLTAVLAAVAPSEEATVEAPTEDRAQALRTILVRTTPVSFESLRAELAPRWPEGEIVEVGAEAFARVEGKSFAYLEIVGEPVGSAPVEITLILSDGRAYVRRSAVLGHDRARALAIAIANLLGTVADEDVPPDRTDAAIPTDAVPQLEPETKPQPQPKPEPVATPPTPASPPVPRRWQLGLQGGGGVVLGLAPAERRIRPVLGGGVKLSLRAPVGVAVGASLRVLGRAQSDHRLTRIRVGLDVAYVGRKDALEWIVGIGPTVEPWLVTNAGQRRALARRAGSGDTVLWGGALFVSLGYHVALARARTTGRGPAALRIGATTELATSTLANGAAARVLLPSDDGEPRTLFSLGGVELAIGLDVTLWFDLAKPGRARTRTSASIGSNGRERPEI